jgi:hypothetical protein
MPPATPATATQNVTVTDTTAPVVTAPADVAAIVSGPTTPVNLNGPGTAVDLVDGPVTPVTPDNVGPFPPGETIVTWAATDAALNTGTAPQTVQVLYDFAGFQPPIDNLPVVNSGKAGKVVPVKWQIRDGNGSFIRDLGVVSSIQFAPVLCDDADNAFEDPIEAEATGGTGLRYDTADEHFVYNWKTDKGMNGDCFVLALGLFDGTQHLAKFSLK